MRLLLAGLTLALLLVPSAHAERWLEVRVE
jgi:hypothetical protein